MTRMPKLIWNLKPQPNRRDFCVNGEAQENEIPISVANAASPQKKKSAIYMADFS